MKRPRVNVNLEELDHKRRIAASFSIIGCLSIPILLSRSLCATDVVMRRWRRRRRRLNDWQCVERVFSRSGGGKLPCSLGGSFHASH
jgi:hypothetical protein